VVGFEVIRSLGAGDVEVANGVTAALGRFKAVHPEIAVERVFNTVDMVYEAYLGQMEMIFEGSFLAVLVVVFFLRNMRATLVAATALPLAVIPTFAAMYLLGFFHQPRDPAGDVRWWSGLLVDDAIVEIENIMRHLEMARRPTRPPWRPPTRSAWR